MMETIRQKAERMLDRTETLVLATVDEKGFPRPVPMVKLYSDGFGEIWFSTDTEAEKVSHLRMNPRAGICLYERGNMVALTGTAEVIDDPETKRQMWQEWMIAHFRGGESDPTYCLIRFRATGATYWIDRRAGRETL
ncbi:pyridoxamine 5'-phosphate oxidase family protein [Gallalistipes aquisgranensis]|uniref:pyridoxamine 5'-phosphate oxidase family protein n=1 Tax=Gallalistipes aquisgranensis TaxID=2779358 RepID=UPI001CF8A182|nr:pyridoxamine 5'-phosphate oxidase family protein [Gallalistipes aquisgranensis]MBE5033148.1 pyridoxamine 5'-phosphate oxidase family protein [Gallalistipes aquisgranensis]